MSFNRDFECVVTIYDIKYRIQLTQTDHKYVLFSQLYPKIQNIDPKQEISFETNTFEIFDLRENRFRRIISFNEIIENNSRIRVLIKPQVFKNYLFDSEKSSDVTNSYQTTDYRTIGNTFGQTSDRSSDKSLNYALNGSHLSDNYCNNYNKIDFQLNNRQTNDGSLWGQTSVSSVRGLTAEQSTSSTVRPMVSTVEPSIMASTSSSIAKHSSDYDYRTAAYCPKVVEYSNNGFNFDRNTSFESNCNTNNYQMVGSAQVDQSCDPNVDYILNKLIESRNIILKEQTLEALRGEGVEVKQSFNFEIYLCKVCDECFQTPDSALSHTKSIEHFDQKAGKYSDDLDRKLVIPTENMFDIRVVLARKQEIKKLDLKTKYEFLRHGIRIKDGTGNDAFVCIECKLSFMSFNYVRHHLAKFKGCPEQDSDVVYTSNTFQSVSAVRHRNDDIPSHRSQDRHRVVESLNTKYESQLSKRQIRRRAERERLLARLRENPLEVTPKKRRSRKRNRRRNRQRNTSGNRSPEPRDQKPVVKTEDKIIAIN